MAGGEQSEVAVRDRVLDRFGDPAAVARKLWFDWMWEKIMTQRHFGGRVCAHGACSCLALGLAWASLTRQQDMIAAWQEQQKMFERLLAESQKTQAPSEWNPVEFRFVKGKEDGPPTAGVKVSMSIQAKDTGIPPMEAVSDERGIVRFERVRYGTYEVWIKNTVNEFVLLNLALQPGQSLTRTMVCPATPPVPTNVTVHIAWPTELAEEPIWCRFRQNAVCRPVSGTKWFLSHNLSETNCGGLILAPNGDVIPDCGSVLSDTGPGRSKSIRAYTAYNRGANSLSEALRAIEWPGKDYRIIDIEVLISRDHLHSADDWAKQLPSEVDRKVYGRSPTPRLRTGNGYFNGVTLNSADWSYRIEPGTGDEPGTLWLTPTADAVEKVRAALAEVDEARQAAEKARAELEEKQRPATVEKENVANDGEKNDSTDVEKKDSAKEK